MAYLDDLLAQITDRGLGGRIASEIAKLRQRAQFGLVFERHLPEVVRLYGHSVTGGQLVQLRLPEASQIWRVRVVKGSKVQLEDAASGNQGPTMAVDDVVPVHTFGDPIYPGLASLGSVHRSTSTRGSHVVVSGENFDVLQMLTHVHEGEVDCIYLDPPYNTGDQNWKYNNDYVDRNDAYRHSKWLSMMERRLRLAKRLLKPDGVIVVTIDAHEVNRLGVLLGQMFPSAEIQMVSIVINPSGASSGGLSRVDEYAFFCFFGGAQPVPLARDLLTDDEPNASYAGIRWLSLMRGGNAWYRASRPNLCYPILLDRDDRIVGVGEPAAGDDDHLLRVKVGRHAAAWPVRADGRLGIWRVDRNRLMYLAEHGFAHSTGRDEARGTWTILYLLGGIVDAIEGGELTVTGYGEHGEVLVAGHQVRTTIPKTVWKSSSHTAGGQGGTVMLNNLLGERNRFTFPKSVYAVQDTLAAAVGDRPDALILDFFGGSGTTVHATAMLNAADGGSRRCILVTNNEVELEREARLTADGYRPGDPEWNAQGVFSQATKPRIEAAITGHRPTGEAIPPNLRYIDGRRLADGFEENVDFFELQYLDRDEVDLGEAFKGIAPLLWMKGGACGVIADTPDGAWFAPDGSPYAVLFSVSHWRLFVEHIQNRHDLKEVFVVTDAEATFVQVRQELPSWVNASMLYRDYLRSFEILDAQL